MARSIERTLWFVLILLIGVPTLVLGEALVDPMRPQNFKPKSSISSGAAESRIKAQSWRLTTVLIAEQRSVAVINGKALQLGEQIEGYRLVEVEADRVLLKKGTSRIQLRRTGTGLVKKSH